MSYFVSEPGHRHVRRREDGQVHWHERIGGNHSASPFAAAGMIYSQRGRGDDGPEGREGVLDGVERTTVGAVSFLCGTDRRRHPPPAEKECCASRRSEVDV